jgi:Tfp pilus assembly protein PilE
MEFIAVIIIAALANIAAESYAKQERLKRKERITACYEKGNAMKECERINAP